MKKHLFLYCSILFFNLNIFSQIPFEAFFIEEGGYMNQGDFDNDGDIDVLGYSFMDNTNTLTLYENIDGQGTFEVGSVSTINNINTIAIADFDNDGFLDLGITGFYNYIRWYKNDGQGSFEFQSFLIQNVARIGDIKASDIDGDGDMDIITSFEDNDDFGIEKIVWFENLDGLGNFSDQIDIDNIWVTESIVTEDIDGDTDIDIITLSDEDRIRVYKNDGNGNFDSLPNIYIGSNITSIVTKDLDSDNDLDIIITDQDDSQILWLENIDGNGTFGNERIVSDLTYEAQFVDGADMDNDGDIDLVSFSSYGPPSFETRLAWHENIDGLGNFALDHLIPIEDLTNSNNRLKIADINNDGRNDIVTPGLYWFHNQLVSNQIEGYLKLDINNNGCDSSDILLSNIMIKTDNGSQEVSTFSQASGFYQLFVGFGEFETSITGLPSYFSVDPISHSSSFSDYGNIDEADFCLESTQTINDLNISVYPLSDARPGFDVTYQMVFRNVGTTQLSGDIIFEYDDSKIQFLNASETVTSQTINALTFNYSNLNPFEIRTIDLTFNVYPPPTTVNDDILNFSAIINPISGDSTEDDNTFTFNQTVIGSFDPNDIQVLEGSQILYEDIDNYLHYIIRFQNTGTASAINVIIENSLDEKLDWSTIQLESLSHQGRVEIRDGSEVEFIFENINLPDSTNDEPNSHGFITYKIKPKSDIQIGDVILNTADIFFDFNPPIQTNTVITTIVEELSINDSILNSLSIFPNPTNSRLNIISESSIVSVEVYNSLGQIVYMKNSPNGINEIIISEIKDGFYFIKLTNSNSESIIKKIIKR